MILVFLAVTKRVHLGLWQKQSLACCIKQILTFCSTGNSRWLNEYAFRTSHCCMFGSCVLKENVQSLSNSRLRDSQRATLFLRMLLRERRLVALNSHCRSCSTPSRFPSFRFCTWSIASSAVELPPVNKFSSGASPEVSSKNKSPRARAAAALASTCSSSPTGRPANPTNLDNSELCSPFIISISSTAAAVAEALASARCSLFNMALPRFNCLAWASAIRRSSGSMGLTS